MRIKTKSFIRIIPAKNISNNKIVTQSSKTIALKKSNFNLIATKVYLQKYLQTIQYYNKRRQFVHSGQVSVKDHAVKSINQNECQP